MATDYDTLRVREETDPAAEILAQLDTRRAAAAAATLVDDEEIDDEKAVVSDVLEVLDVRRPGLVGDDLMVTVLARQADEFVCSRCFLVHHRSRFAQANADKPICRECV